MLQGKHASKQVPKTYVYIFNSPFLQQCRQLIGLAISVDYRLYSTEILRHPWQEEQNKQLWFFVNMFSKALPEKMFTPKNNDHVTNFWRVRPRNLKFCQNVVPGEHNFVKIWDS